ncbi:hypothetical protein PaeCFBP13512_08730 [Paenibacillus sp. CFBP13512]|uniref:DUF2326 domain-containing protein n=1 Tax=Paenibacillus sp. CFBP13512 TaxID=2184007 RepID=UPI0010BF7013|nr:DUF2326 domain-containing protein [Paenibacillus sp. CFBP13512]TKJ91418.1 hypothetical protein PaeCFBP13512_08730 [Paenibacillus sp. CFBP13512]
MLKEINCEIFKEKKIKFHKGLNVVKGDNQASNSIGKSTLLMIIDFVFGGTTYIDHNKDVMAELGHHKFDFIMEFEQKFYFSRNTEEPKKVYRCNSNFKVVEELSVTAYNTFLKEKYNIIQKSLTFRAAVSLYSRVWGKYNSDVKRPLHTYPKEKNDKTINRFLSLFNEYDQIIDFEKNLEILQTSKKVMNKAMNFEYIPKVNKKIYSKNVKELEKLNQEIENAKSSIVNITINISEEISNKAFQLQLEKKSYLVQKNYYKNRLERINNNIDPKTNKKENFQKLTEFFPEVNLEKLENIESFHKGITRVLGQELNNARKEVQTKLEIFDLEIKKIDSKINELIDTNEQPNYLIRNILELSNRLKTLELENSFYEKQETLKIDIENAESLLVKNKRNSINKIKGLINNKIEEINNFIHIDKRRTPSLILHDKDYEYKIFDNTGTGKAYSNLFVLDLSVFSLTVLPFLIHDSFLFKNIENSVIENIINVYQNYDKQIFIAIDEISKYNEKTQEILEKGSVINLSKDHLLFIKDWRKN